MKRNLFFALFSFVSLLGYSQTGPGGVGSSSNIEAWLEANSLGLSNNDAVSTWSDISGNGNDATESTGSNQPLFITSQVNGYPIVRFDGSDDRLGFGTNINTSAVSTFMVYSRTSGSTIITAPITLGKHIIYSQPTSIFSYYLSPTTKYPVSATESQFSVYGMKTGSASTGTALRLRNRTTTNNYTRTGLFSNSFSGIGAKRNSSSSYSINFKGDIAEIIVFNEELNDASFNIITNHLAAKYGLTTSPDYYAYDASYGNDVKGIGQEANGSNTSARGNDSLLISNASALGTGDYLLVGHDNGGYGVSASVPSGIEERWSQVWRATVTGTPGTISVEFFLGANGFSSPANYAVLIESGDGDFSNGGTSIHTTGLSYNAVNNSISFTSVSLSDGDYFTLAEASTDITSDASGAWNSASTWSCNCIPSTGDIVIIDDDAVTIGANAEALNLTIESAGSLSFSGSDTLFVYLYLTIDGSLTSGSGTIATTSDANAQTMDNGSGSRIELNNLYINNALGTDINSGEWSIKGSLQVSGGGLDVSSADSIFLLSSASQTSQILESMDNAFTGDFTIQRYISSRNANYANISSPISSATVADIDDDLLLSGVGGDDGNAATSGGGIFYSMWTYNNQFQDHDSLYSTANSLTPGKGYEVYLADNTSTFNGRTLDFTGSPNNGLNSGSNRQILFRNWNLFGNPYHAFISYDSLDKTFAPDNFYIYNSSNGSYDFFSGGSKPLIAPCQGFWVFKTVGGGHFFDFNEKDKVSSTTSSFVRQKSESKFTLKVSNNQNPFNHKMFINFNPYASNEVDEMDGFYLPSPIKQAPAIYAIEKESNSKLIQNTLNSFEETQVVPLTVYTGENGTYTISSDNLDKLYEYYSCAYIKNNESNEVVDLLVENTYQFNSEEGIENNFTLVLSNSFESCNKLIEKEAELVQEINHSLSLRQSYSDWFVDFNFGSETKEISIKVLNMNGQEVINPVEVSAENAGSFRINGLENLSGVFLIQVISQKEIISKTVKL